MESDESQSWIEPPSGVDREGLARLRVGQLFRLLAGFFPEEGGGPPASQAARVPLVAPPGSRCS